MSAATLRLSDDTAALARLTRLYLGGFWAVVALFYAGLVLDGYQPLVAILASATGGLACVFLRIAHRTLTAPPAAVARAPARTVAPTALLSERELIGQLDLLMHTSPRVAGGVGVMFVSIENDASAENPLPPATVFNLVRGHLYREADSRIYQVDEHTLAIAERRREVSLHLDQIAVSLQNELRARRTPGSDFMSVRLVAGVAIVEGLKAPPNDLLANARAAIRLAETHGRDTFFRHV